jgi:Trypsin-co-occurring domain 1
MPERPEKIDVEFSLKLTAAADVLIAKTSVDGAFKVSLSWANKR